MDNVGSLIEIYKENNLELTDKEIKRAFGESLRELREHVRITQGELAEKTSVSRQSISVYEKGEITPTITNAYKIALFFNLSVEDFIIYGLKAQKVFDEEFSDITEKYDIENL